MNFGPYQIQFQCALMDVAFWDMMATNAPTPELADEYVKRFHIAITRL